MVSSLSSDWFDRIVSRLLMADEGMRVPTMRLPLSSLRRTTWEKRKCLCCHVI